MSVERALTRSRGSVFGRINWDSPAAVNELSANRPAPVYTSGTVIMFGCGCASWITAPDGARVPDLEFEAARLSAAYPDRWDGAYVARWCREGRGTPRLHEGTGEPMPTYLTCEHGAA